MNVKEAAEAVKRIKPKIVIPMHYGKADVVFMGVPMHIKFDPDLDEFKNKVGSISEVNILREGEEIKI